MDALTLSFFPFLPLIQVTKEVAVKQLDRNGFQGNREFLVEVLILSLLHHPNLVELVSYRCDGDQRVLVYEYMANGSLEDHFLGMTNTILFTLSLLMNMTPSDSGRPNLPKYLKDWLSKSISSQHFK